MQDWVKTVPKAVLHDHLDGGLRVETLIDLANKQNYKDLPSTNHDELKKWIQPKPNKSLAINLEAWSHTIGVMQDSDSIYRVTMEALEDLSNDGVVYAELRFAPLVHTFKGLSTNEVINSVINGIKDGMEKFDIISGVILCAMRQEQNSLEVVNLCIEHNDVVGFDLAGPEVGFSVLNHDTACALALKNNINVTLHADWEVPEGIKEVVLDSKAKRIGHGSQIINDISLDNGDIKFNNDAAKYVFDNKIALEICPTSNVQCGAFTDVSEHSFGKLYQAGFNVTINTDNRLMSDITMSEEVNNVVESFNLTEKDILKITNNTIEAGFVEPKLKNKLLEKLSL
tara:strand:+ start:1706 stop:2728 length:1023 start_codon:yes stop_codon:yes gene_type:complete